MKMTVGPVRVSSRHTQHWIAVCPVRLSPPSPHHCHCAAHGPVSLTSVQSSAHCLSLPHSAIAHTGSASTPLVASRQHAPAVDHSSFNLSSSTVTLSVTGRSAVCCTPSVQRVECGAMLSRLLRSAAPSLAARVSFRAPHLSRPSSVAASARPAGPSTAQSPLSAAGLHLHNGRLGRQGGEYVISQRDIDSYHAKGYIALPAVLSEDELADIERTYMKFMTREIRQPTLPHPPHSTTRQRTGGQTRAASESSNADDKCCHQSAAGGSLLSALIVRFALDLDVYCVCRLRLCAVSAQLWPARTSAI